MSASQKYVCIIQHMDITNEVKPGAQIGREDVAKILKNPALKITEFRVLAHLIEHLESDAYRPVSITKLARSINHDRPRVSAAVATLAAQKIIIRGTKIGREFTYRINL